MWTDEELTQLEEEEHTLTEEALVLMWIHLNYARSELEKELRAFYQKYGKDGVVTYQEARKWVSSDDHTKRLIALYAVMNSQLDDLLDDLIGEFDLLLKDVIKKESEFFGTKLGDLSLNWGVDDLDWLERLEGNVELWKARLKIDWKQSLLKKQHIDSVLEDLNTRFDSIEKVLEKLVLTESTAVGTIARRQILKDLGFTKYRFYSRPDERRCEVCGSMHGLTFPMTAYEVGVTASPLHPRCRCWEVPIRD